MKEGKSKLYLMLKDIESISEVKSLVSDMQEKILQKK